MIFLLRHGETEWNTQSRLQGQLDSKLTPEGEVQMQQTGQLLSQELKKNNFNMVLIVSSDLGRARQSTEFILKSLKQQFETRVSYDKRARERSLGLLSGHTWPELMSDYPDIFKERQTHIETNGSCIERFNRCLHESIKRTKSGEALVIVTHGSITTAFAESRFKGTSTYTGAKMANASLTLLKKDGGKLGVVYWGKDSHLSTKTTTTEQKLEVL